MAGDAERLGPWAPISAADAVDLFRPAPLRWWLAGGHALEAHLGQGWRTHDDTDIGITRADAPALRSVLAGWDIHVAWQGALTPWDGQPPDAVNLWCRPSPDAPWALDILVGDGSAHEWIYKRDQTIRRPWSDAVLTTADRVPYLAPEIQLLFKSATPRPKDDLDAATVIPVLNPDRRSWLANHLQSEHPWQSVIVRT